MLYLTLYMATVIASPILLIAAAIFHLLLRERCEKRRLNARPAGSMSHSKA
jgi:energy-converting hydrogenase Eha subunit F